MQTGGILQILQSDWPWERAKFFYLACQPQRNPSLGCMSLCNDLKFPFFDTESVYMQKYSVNYKTRGMEIVFECYQAQCESTIKKGDFREEEKERGKNYSPAKGPSVEQNTCTF